MIITKMVHRQLARCETIDVQILCCPEGVVGGLADYVEAAHRFVLPADPEG
jgi:hypothetical protein